VPFSDGITFEIVPAFLNQDEVSYTFPDSSGGGSWKATNPKPEIMAIAEMDTKCNSNLKPLCKMMRAWKSTWNVPMNGLHIDTLAHNFIEDWRYRDKSYLYYDWMSRDFFDYMSQQDSNQQYWRAPGSGQSVQRRGDFEYKAKRCHNLALQAIQQAADGHEWSSRETWREIYGTSYPH
jgi:hypothetical protein